MTMFDRVPMAPQDAILGLGEAFAKDPNPNKINLSVGVYQDASGRTPVLESVRLAQQRVVQQQSGMEYLEIAGSPEYARAAQQLILGSQHEAIASERVATSHTPGGTGALRIAADFIRQLYPTSRVWLSEPTWPNHPSVFAAAGLHTESYAYFDKRTNGIAWDAMLEALEKIPAGDVVVLHACCHNPTGIDPTPRQWEQIGETIRSRGVLPLVDFAYQGFAEGIWEDTTGLRALCPPGAEAMVCSSFSKNFGLYRHRVGALTVVAAERDAAAKVQSQIKRCIRASYSNPPAHGAALVTEVLGDPELKQIWENEVNHMRHRIDRMRTLFVERLRAHGVPGDFSFMARQRGMFSFSGLTPEQVDSLRENDSIYIVRSGRINVAGMTEDNMDRLCGAMAQVLGSTS
jgi:aspartate/tyrosine/aromatic aminotransferase